MARFRKRAKGWTLKPTVRRGRDSWFASLLRWVTATPGPALSPTIWPTLSSSLLAGQIAQETTVCVAVFDFRALAAGPHP
jgi:hypothetical protein